MGKQWWTSLYVPTIVPTMASIWKNPKSKYLVACYTDANGRRLKRSTGTTDKKLALKIANDFEKATRAKRTAKQARRVLSDIFRELSGDELPTMTVREFFTGYVERKKPEVSRATLDYYSGHAKRFLVWLGPKSDGDISEITKQDVTGYRNHVSTTAGARTTNNTLKAIKTFFSAAKKDGFLGEDPSADVDTVRDRSESAKRSFTMDELKAVMAVADEEWKSLIYFGLYTGQRLADLATLTWQNLDLAVGEIRLTTRKTGRRQTLPLAQPLLNHISGLKGNDDPAAPIHPRSFAILQRAGGMGRSSQLSNSFAKVLAAAGLRSEIEVEAGNARAKHPLSFHSLRHTATSLLKAAGVPQSVVMAYIGHDSADVSHGYTHTGKEQLSQAAAAIPQL